MRRAYADVVAALAETDGVTCSRMFGSEALKLRGKVFVMDVKGRLVAKLATARVAELVGTGLGVAFDPGHGRPMKQWIAVAQDADLDWVALAQEALEFAARG